MDVLFLHPNFPGQFTRLAQRLNQEPDFQVYTLGDASWMSNQYTLPGAQHWAYEAPEPAGQDTHRYVKNFDAAVRRGQQVVRTLLPHKHQGFEPDVIYVHPGWGDGLYLKELFPAAQIISLFEYFYHARGADVGFDPEFPLAFNDLFRLRTLNTVQLHALEGSDQKLSPTEWQRSRYPAAYRAAITCLHEGIDTARVVPDPQATLTLSNGLTLRAGDEVLTYVSRGLEPYRGFHCLMRALPEILRQRPRCQVLIVGGDKARYGPEPNQAASWRELYLDELGGQMDLARVHFTGTLPYNDYLRVLQVSRAHVYLTYPFILSWSMMEAMAAGCLLLGSDTPPVRELLRHGENGLLFPFFEREALVNQAVQALAEPERFEHLRRAAIAGIKSHYDFDTVVYPRHLALLRGLATPH